MSAIDVATFRPPVSRRISSRPPFEMSRPIVTEVSSYMRTYRRLNLNHSAPATHEFFPAARRKAVTMTMSAHGQADTIHSAPPMPIEKGTTIRKVTTAPQR